MPIVNGYATRQEYQESIGRTVDASDVNLATIERAIESASRFIDEHTGQIFYSRTITDEAIDVFDISENKFWVNDDRCSLRCPARILSITSVVQDGVTLTADTDYFAYAVGTIRFASLITLERKGVVITGVFGHSATPVAVRLACCQIAAVISGLEVRTVMDAAGDEQTILLRSIPKWVSDLLFRLRRHD